jgi:uncharacterized membrane protein YdbT with pleckstrin-like domain
MIPLNQEQNLGRKSWQFMLYKKSSVAIGLVFLAVIIGMSKDIVSSILAALLKSSMKDAVLVEKAISSSVSFLALVILIIGVIVFVYGYIVCRLHYKNFTFTLEDYGIKLKKGIFYTKEISIPYRQIQNVDVTKTLVYQFFKLSRLVIITAGHEDEKGGDETDTVFDPIDSDIAEEIREMLQKRIGVQIVDGGVSMNSSAKMV